MEQTLPGWILDYTPNPLGKIKPPGGKSETEKLNKEARKRADDSVKPYQKKLFKKGYECGDALAE